MAAGCQHECGAACGQPAAGDHSVERLVQHAQRTGWRQQLVGVVAHIDNGALRWSLYARPRRRWRASALPSLGHHQVRQRLTLRPSETFQPRPWLALVWVADTQPTECLHAVGNAQQCSEVGGSEKSHPADTQTGRSRRQPQVLNRAGARPHVGVDECRPTEHSGRFGPSITAHHESEGGFANSLQLQRQ